MDDCIFCIIANGEIADYRIYENDDVVAFLDIHPCAKGHTVIIPKKHHANLNDVSEEELPKIATGLLHVYHLVDKKIHADGYNIGLNNGRAAGQAIGHLHWHIIPRWENDGGGSMHSIVRNGDGIDVKEIFSLFK
jgi:histidine triad (HIT) family protein